MPSSSRRKSHKKHKQSSKEGRERREDKEYSDSEGISSHKHRKDRRDREDDVIRVSKDSVSSEKRKLGSSKGEGSDSKRMKERIDDSAARSKVSVDAKSSKSSRKHESCVEKKEVSVGLVVESEEVKRSSNSSGRVELKVKPERESSRKEVYECKELKDREPGVGKSSNDQDARSERSVKGLVDGDRSRKRSSPSNQCTIKPEVRNIELKQPDLRSLELVKELEKQSKKEKNSFDKDEHPEATKDSNGRRILMNDEKHKDDRSKDKYQEDIDRDHRVHDRSKDKYREDIVRDHRVRDRSKDKYREDTVRDHRIPVRSKEKYQEDTGRDHRVHDRSKDKYQEDTGRDSRAYVRSIDKYQDYVGRDLRGQDKQSSKDHTNDGSYGKHSRDERKSAVENPPKKSKIQSSGRDGSPCPDDRTTRHQDNYHQKKKLSHNDNDSDCKPRNPKEHCYEVEKKVSSGKGESVSDRGVSHSRVADNDLTVSFSRKQSSPSTAVRFSKDIVRQASKQVDLRYQDSVSEDRDCVNVNSSQDVSFVPRVPERIYESRSTDEPKPVGTPINKDQSHLAELHSKGSPVLDAQGSPLQLKDEVQSSTSIEDRPSNRTPVNCSIDVDETEHRSGGSTDVNDDSVYEGKGNKDLPIGNLVADESFQADGDTPSNRTLMKCSIDVDETGHRSCGSKDVKNDYAYEDKGSKDWPIDNPITDDSLQADVDTPSNRTPAKCSIDVDETRHRSCGFKDVKDAPVYEYKVRKNWPIENPIADDSSRAGGDTVLVSSSVNRTNHLSVSSSSVHPPPPFRTIVDRSSGSCVEDHRGKSSNRYKKFHEPNMGKGFANAWKGVPKWSTPEANGFVPFQQGPPPGGFHPMMQQFHGPPIFGGRSTMELNPPGGAYHITDSDRYSGHGHSFGWKNRADDTGPHLHGWNGNNGGFVDMSHVHEKPDWDQTKHMMRDQVWEASTEMWKGQNNALTMDLPPVPWKEDNQLGTTLDEGGAWKPGQRSRNDHSRSVSRSESIEIKTLDDIPVDHVAIEALKQVVLEKSSEPSKTLDKHNFCHVYLSKLDISVDLAHPDLYKQCISLLDMERISTDGGDCKDLSAKGNEKSEGKITHTSFITPHFPEIKDSVLKRAMALYQQRGKKMNAKVPISFFIQAGQHIPPTNEVEKLYPDPTIINQIEVAGSFLKGVEVLIPTSEKVNVEEVATVFSNVKYEVDISSQGKVEDSVPTFFQEKAVKHLYSDQDKRDGTVANFGDNVLEPVQSLGSKQPVEIVPQSVTQPLINASTNMEDHTIGDSKSRCSAYNPKGNNTISSGIMCGSLGLTDDSEALVPMSVECKSVNLSWIHSPESTH